MINFSEFIKDKFAIPGLIQHFLFIAHLVLMMCTNKQDFGGVRISFCM